MTSNPPERQDEWLNEPCPTCLKSLSDEEVMNVYQTCKQGLDIENNLVNFRVSWAIALTAAFLTAESFVLGRVLDLSTSGSYNILNYLIGIMAATLSAFAAWFCWRTRSGVGAALSQIDYLKHWLLQSQEHFDRRCLPAPYGDNRGYRLGHGTASMFPLVMFLMWLLLSGAQFFWVSEAALSNLDYFRAITAVCWALVIVLASLLLELRNTVSAGRRHVQAGHRCRGDSVRAA